MEKSKKNFLLLSLEDDKAKKIANVVNNSSCRKILDFLTENEATETEISKKLNIPISTVHYNLKQLLDSKLIVWEKYHYSEKGREVRHYTVANKYIIIAPKSEKSSIIDKLKTIIPTTLLLFLGTYFVSMFTNINKSVENLASSNVVYESLPRAMPEMADGGANLKMAAYDMAEEEIIHETSTTFFEQIFQSYAFWFLIGAITGIFIYLLIKYVRKKLKKKS